MATKAAGTTGNTEAPKGNGLDLSESVNAIAHEDAGIPVELTDHKDDPVYKADGSPVVWLIAGGYSSKFREALEKSRQREQKRRGQPMSVEDSIRDNAEFLADCSIGWDGITDKGQPLAFTRDRAVDVLVKLPFVRNKLAVKQHDHRGFFLQLTTSNDSPPSSATAHG